mmetsp:Transcript_50277/g.101160  ORF Transcript_50277/g.101160 Transcript_50277/m.101160 type:complete len:120 (-) Transcript_50277:120-479(-)
MGSLRVPPLHASPRLASAWLLASVSLDCWPLGCLGHLHARSVSTSPLFKEGSRRPSAGTRRCWASSAAWRAWRLHQHVSQVAEDYHKTVVSLNAQLLHWDKTLSRRRQPCERPPGPQPP